MAFNGFGGRSATVATDIEMDMEIASMNDAIMYFIVLVCAWTRYDQVVFYILDRMIIKTAAAI